ncbi:unnamed protein product, partial [Mycena citricolor]
ILAKNSSIPSADRQALQHLPRDNLLVHFELHWDLRSRHCPNDISDNVFRSYNPALSGDMSRGHRTKYRNHALGTHPPLPPRVQTTTQHAGLRCSRAPTSLRSCDQSRESRPACRSRSL